MNLNKTDYIQFIFTKCLYSLIPNCSYNSNLTLAEMGPSWAYQLFLIPKPDAGRSPEAQGTFLLQPLGRPQPWQGFLHFRVGLLETFPNLF